MAIRPVRQYVDPVAKYFGKVTGEERKDMQEKTPAAPRKKTVRRKLSEFPRYASEFCVEKNGVSPEDVSAMSHTRYWWRCPGCGHEWQTSCNNRVYGVTGCPRCVKQRSRSRFAR